MMLLAFATISLFIFCIGTRSDETIIESVDQLKQALDDLTAAFLKLLERMFIKCKYLINIQLIIFLKAVQKLKKR
jgi:hypothetical protein